MILSLEEKLKVIKESVSKLAHDLKEYAEIEGDMGDGGASIEAICLSYWIDGIEFGKTGVTHVYSKIIQDHIRDNDPDYIEFLRLKEKFRQP